MVSTAKVLEVPSTDSDCWFTRGWTLQELIAPVSVDFYSKERTWLGNKTTLEQEILHITKLPVEALRGNVHMFNIEQRLTWADGRKTTREEDAVYCLFGLVDVYMAPLYGEEGHGAYHRLLQAIEMSHPGARLSNANPRLETQASAAEGSHDSTYQSCRTRTNPATDVIDFENFLKSLSYPEMEYRKHAVDDAQSTTCRWLLMHPHYRTWSSEAYPGGSLIISGKPGSGKSTAMKRAYTMEKEKARNNEVVTAFFFNSRGVSMETRLEGFLRSSLHQLVQVPGAARDAAFDTWKRKSKMTRTGWEWTTKELQYMFRAYVLKSDAAITVFVDALDECESTLTACNLMDLLSTLGERRRTTNCLARFRICVSRRHYPNIGTSEPLQIIVENNNERDIMKYTRSVLEGISPETDRLSERITTRSQGIILWAFLALQRVREAISDGETTTRLQNLVDQVPQRLEELFDELVRSIPPDQQERCQLVVWLVLSAERPLLLQEIGEALAFRHGYSTYQQYEVSENCMQPTQMKRLLHTCTRGLVEAANIDRYDDSHQRIQFIHESVREYIFDRSSAVARESMLMWFDVGAAHSFLTLSCFNYVKALCTEENTLKTLIERWTRFQYTRGPFATSEREWNFLDYATRFGFEHASAAEANHHPQVSSLEEFAFAATTDAPLWTKFTAIFGRLQEKGHWSRHVTSLLAFACAFKLESLVQDLLSRNRSSLQEDDLSKALCVTASTDNRDTLLLLLREGADVDYDQESLGTPLYISLISGRNEVVPILLEHGASVRKGSPSRHVLVAATSHATLATLKLLLSYGAVVDECDSNKVEHHAGPSIEGTNALEVALKREPAFLETLLEFAERQQLPIQYYITAHLVAVGRGIYSHERSHSHQRILEATISKLFHDRPKIHVFVKDLNSKTIPIHMFVEATVLHLKMEIDNRMGPPPGQVFLSYNSRIIRDESTLLECNIYNQSTVHMLLRMRWQGGHGG